MRNSELEWIDRFIRHLETERRLSANTCKHYRRDLDVLVGFGDELALDTWSEFDDEHLRAWSAACYRRGLSAATIRRRSMAARSREARYSGR